MNINNLKIQSNQFAVGKAEFATGTVLNNDGYYYKINDNLESVFDIFEDFELAKFFAIKKVSENPDVECWIKNYKNETIFYYTKNGEENLKK